MSLCVCDSYTGYQYAGVSISNFVHCALSLASSVSDKHGWVRRCHPETFRPLIDVSDGLHSATAVHKVRWMCILTRWWAEQNTLTDDSFRAVVDPVKFIKQVHYFTLPFNVPWLPTPNFYVFIARSQLHKVLLIMALSVTFLFVHEISQEPLNGFAPNSQEDVFGPSLRQVWMLRSKAKVTRDKKRHFSAFLVACVWSVW